MTGRFRSKVQEPKVEIWAQGAEKVNRKSDSFLSESRFFDTVFISQKHFKESFLSRSEQARGWSSVKMHCRKKLLCLWPARAGAAPLKLYLLLSSDRPWCKWQCEYERRQEAPPKACRFFVLMLPSCRRQEPHLWEGSSSASAALSTRCCSLNTTFSIAWQLPRGQTGLQTVCYVIIRSHCAWKTMLYTSIIYLKKSNHTQGWTRRKQFCHE